MAAESVTMEEKNEYTAYIMRSETVLYAASEGGVSYRCANGEKVSKDSIVARFYSGSNGANVRRELVNYDNKISILSRSSLDEGTRFVGTTIIDQEINEVYATIMSKMAEGDLDFALQKKDELNVLLNQRKVLIGGVTDYDYQVSQYRAKEEALISSLGSAYTEIRASASGYFFTGVDGYETIFDASKVNEMTIDDFDKMTDSDPVTDGTGGYSLGKLITDFKWYIVFEINVEDMIKYTVSQDYNVIFPYNSDKRIMMRLERMITQTNSDRCLLVLSSNESPQNFNYLRAQTIQIVDQQYSGYRVPAAAVRVVDGVRGVYILDGSVVRFRRITPLAEADGYIIVQKQNTLDADSVKYDLGYCDLIITKGKDLYDGKIVE